MNKNEEIRELMEKLLPLCTLADKNFLIGLLNGILWKQKRATLMSLLLKMSLKKLKGFLEGIAFINLPIKERVNCYVDQNKPNY